jgi:lipopolysaccharide assembly outer membrane protein LptD (OstA)
VRPHRLLPGVAFAVLLPALAGTQTLAGKVSLKAQNQQWIQDRLWCGWGDVHVTYQDISLRCREMELDLETLHLVARGDVLFDQGPTRLLCDHLEFDLKDKVGTLYDASGSFPPNYQVQATELEKVDATHWRFKDALFTSCDLSHGTPPWSIQIRSAVVEEEGYGHFRGVSLRTKGVPVFYLPRLLWPVKRGRAAGMLIPHVGYNDRRGAYLGNALFWPISRSFDTTFYLNTYSQGYVGLGEELRWAPAEAAKGFVLFNTIRDTKTKQWEWKLEGKHNQLFPGGYSLRAEALDLSNIDFFQFFEHAFNSNALRTLYSYATFSRAWGAQAYNLGIDHRETFFNSVGGQSAVVLERQPELEYRLRATRISRTPFYLTLVGLADHFRVNRSATLRGKYSRFDLFPSVSMLTPGLSWLSFTPTFGARDTYYTASYSQDRTRLVDEPLSRRYVTAGVSIVGPSFSRIWNRGEDLKLKHLIEPRVEYSYLSDPGDVSRIPVFDEKDSVLVTNRMRMALSNRLFVKRGKTGSREVATFEISQEYSFSEPLTFATAGQPPSKRGPLSFELRLSPVPTSILDARADLDAITHNLRSTSLSVSLAQPSRSLNLTWYTSYNPVDGTVTSSQSRLYAGVAPKGGPWRLETQIAYDLHQQKLLEQSYILRWRGSCWSAYVEVRDYRIAPYQTRDYRIAIDLTGLGTFLDIRGGLGPAGQ